MTTCPNCGHKISETDDICPNCGFNLKNIETTFSQISTKKQKFEEPDEGEKIISRAAIGKNLFLKSKHHCPKNDCVG